MTTRAARTAAKDLQGSIAPAEGGTPASEQRSQPKPPREAIIEAVIPPDTAFINARITDRDRAVKERARLEGVRAMEAEFYDREMQRVAAARDVVLFSLDAQIGQQRYIEEMCDASLTLQQQLDNVVPLRGDLDGGDAS